jgi:hypothetical protein
MKRMMRAAAVAAILTSGLGSIGCVNTGTCGSGGSGGGTGVGGRKTLGDCYRNAVDPCYPERYSHAARQAVIAPFAQQVLNGHVLNQTIWNYYFEFGTDKLTPAGIEKLTSLARERPAPDPKIFIQTARDIPATTDPTKIPDVRAELDTKRAASIRAYMATQPAFAPVAYEFYVHDPATPGINAEMASSAYRSSLRGYTGTITGSAGMGALSTGGSTNLTVIGTGGGGGTPAGSSTPAPGAGGGRP